jgi:hypothetical protein
MTHLVAVTHLSHGQTLKEVKWCEGTLEMVNQWVSEHFPKDHLVSVVVKPVVVPEYPCHPLASYSPRQWLFVLRVLKGEV